MDLGVAIPILPARNLHETRAFYERLGFRTERWWPQEFGGYAILVRGNLEMHFFAFADIPPDQNSGCYWRVQNVDALYEECQASGLTDSGTLCLLPVENKPWGTREFALIDPNGNLIRVGQLIPCDT